MFELFGYSFVWRAVIASILSGITCGIVGVWVLLLNIPFIGIAMSHAAFAGAVLGLLWGINPLVLSLVFCALTAVFIGPIADRGDVSVNVSIGILFSFALGIAFLGMGLMKGPKTEALNFLWGNILTVSVNQLFILAGTTGIIIILLYIFNKQVGAVLYSREIAKAVGIPEQLILYLMLFFCGMTVTLNLNAIGGILIFSLITSSPLAAYQLTYRMRTLYVLSAFFGVLSCITGLFISYVFDVPSGAVIIIVSSVIFLVCMQFSPKKRSGAWIKR